MLEVFFATLSAMLMMFSCIVIGYVVKKTGVCPDNTGTVLSKLETNVLIPALTISTFSRYCTVESLGRYGKMMLFSGGAVVLAILLAYLLSPLFEKKGYRQNVYRYAIAFANSGFMGNAIVPAVLGEAMLYEYLLFTLPIQLGIYTWGVSMLVPKKGGDGPVKRLVKSPIILSIALGMLLGLTGAAAVLPDFVMKAVDSLKACMGPVAMVLTGFVIGGYPLKTLVSDKKIYPATLLRLFVLPALYVGLMLLLGADDLTLTLCTFAFATPLGLNTVVFPAAYGQDTAPGAAMATVSHTLCVISIPVMVALLQWVLSVVR